MKEKNPVAQQGVRRARLFQSQYKVTSEKNGTIKFKEGRRVYVDFHEREVRLRRGKLQ